MVISGKCGALSNFCMRNSLEKKGSQEVFFLFQLTCTALFVGGINASLEQNFYWDRWTVLLAVLAGLSIGSMKWGLGKALSQGPSGLTFAVCNSATLAPSLLLFLIFQPWVACEYSWAHFIGSVLIAAGLFWAGWEIPGGEKKKKWLFWTISAFFFHLLFLAVNEWRRISLQHCFIEPNFLFFDAPGVHSSFFAPLLFLSASSFHLFLLLKDKHLHARPQEIGWGILGGICNGLSAYFFIKGTEIAGIKEAPLLFPAYTIALVIVCHLWSERVFHEKVHWASAAVCVVGLLFSAFFPSAVEENLLVETDPRKGLQIRSDDEKYALKITKRRNNGSLFKPRWIRL